MIPPFIRKRRNTTALMKAVDYNDFRRMYWASQNNEGVEFRASTKHGERFTEVMFEPRPIFNYKDTWHCVTAEKAAEVASYLCTLKFITELKWRGPYISVDFGHDQSKKSASSVLPGQHGDGKDFKAKAPY